MTALFPLLPDEAERFAAVARLRLFEAPRSVDFDAVLALALQVTGCQAGLIGLMEEDRHRFIAERGIGQADVPRDLSFANYTLLQTAPLIVEDLAQDARFRDNPIVTERGARFYAGVALAGESDQKVGTLCLTDLSPRAATPELADALRHLGRVIEGMLEAEAQVVAFAMAARARDRELWRQSHLIAQTERLAKVGAWELDLETKTYFVSKETLRIHEIEDDDSFTMEDLRSRMPANLRVQATALFERCLATGQGYEYKGQFSTRKGKNLWQHVIAEAEQRDGKVIRIFGTTRDITAEHFAEQDLWRAAHYDVLTESPNRHYWSTRLDEAFATAVADQTGLTILMFDLDGFKEINDTRGHAIGDAVLRDMAKRLAETLPESAFHARLGGDEFAVLLEGSLTKIEIETTVRGLLAAIQRPIVYDSLRLQISGTFGSASFPSDAATASDLMQKADIALYQAKRSHRSSFVSFRAEIGDLFNDKRHAIDLVAAAIEQNRLVPFYQPKFDLKSGRPAGFEALCRIEAADGTILGPNQFQPALRDPASSARIGSAMLDLVTADIATWLTAGLAPGRVAFNVTSADFASGDLDRRVLDRLAALALPPSALEIEVTENTILGKEAMVVGEALQAMRDQGMIIALDDFGTGYASLTHLRDAPIHYIKLDRSFISGLGRNAGNAIIVRSIVDLGHSLGMRIVAEGIETKGQADFLRAIGCDEAQGFLYGRPASRVATRRTLEDLAQSSRAAAVRPDPLHDRLLKAVGRPA